MGEKKKKPQWPYFGLSSLVAASESQKWHLDQLVVAHAKALAQNMRHDEVKSAMKSIAGLTQTNCGWSDYQAAQVLTKALREEWPAITGATP